jgi:GNAT superfamily N-acetyltransferase
MRLVSAVATVGAMTLDIRSVEDDGTAEIWRRLHNAIITTDRLSRQEVKDRLSRYHLTVAYADGHLIGNATVRPADHLDPATVIVRILPEYRRRGHGSLYLRQLVADDPVLRDGDLRTVVLLANQGGLPFAHVHGFVEVDRYEVDGAEYADLIRRSSTSAAAR